MVDILTAAMGAKMASGAVQSQIDTALSSVYKYKGQCTNTELANKTKTAGDVWEITDAGTYAAGTDVVCDGTNWAAMVGHLHVNVVDDLVTQSSTDALSANMGYALAQAISSAGGGGDWVENTDNDWSNIFERDSSDHIKVKKDVYIYWKNGYTNFGFLPKGLVSRTDTIYLSVPDFQPSTVTSYTFQILCINTGVSVKYITMDVGSQTITTSTMALNKSDFTVLVKD